MPSLRDTHFEFEETALPLLDSKPEGIERSSSSEEYIHLRQTSSTSHTHDTGFNSQYDTRNDEPISGKPRRRTPLPLLQLFILCTTRLSEPIAYTQIFPVSLYSLPKEEAFPPTERNPTSTLMRYFPTSINMF